jgi:hypothetical protein
MVTLTFLRPRGASHSRFRRLLSCGDTGAAAIVAAMARGRRDALSAPDGPDFQQIAASFDTMPVGAMHRRNDLSIALHDQYPAASVVSEMHPDSRGLNEIVIWG